MHHRSHDQGGLVKGGLFPLSRGVFVQGSLCPGGFLSRGHLPREGVGGLCLGSLSRERSLSGGVSVLRVSVWGSLSREVSVWALCPGGLCPEGSLSRGSVSGKGSLSEGSLSRRRSLSRRKSLSRRRSMSCGNTKKKRL